MHDIKIVFAGTPEFSVPCLTALLAGPGQVVAVYTQPDRPAGRGRRLAASPVKEAALADDLPVRQPATLKDPAAVTELAAFAPDLMVVVAYGLLLPPAVLATPRLGCINVHASLLPRWRGAAPIQAAIRAGDAETGITIMVMDAGLDTGPMLSQRAVPLEARETGQSLHDKLAALGGSLLLETLPGYLDGTITPQAQPEDESLVTYAPQIKKQEGEIDWTQSAAVIDRLVRAFTPWPGTFTYWHDQRLKIIAGHAAAGQATPGRVIAHGDALAIGTGDGLYLPEELQLPGRKALPADDFVRGQADIISATLGNPTA